MYTIHTSFILKTLERLVGRYIREVGSVRKVECPPRPGYIEGKVGSNGDETTYRK